MTTLRWIGRAYALAAVVLVACFYRYTILGTYRKAAGGVELAELSARVIVMEEIMATIAFTFLLGAPIVLGIWIWQRAWNRLERR